jgi:aryl-alcohol dehydrogenase-like predicted oxidoreductase
MEYQKIGKTKLNISRLGFGGWQIGGHGWEDVDDKKSIQAIHKALDLGVNFFDTADIYGLGHSEEILSKGLGEKRKEVVIATKGGLRWNKEKNIAERDLSSEYITKAVENSLKRLNINSISLYQIHYPDPKTPIQETIKTLEKLKKQGKIQHIGCSNFDLNLVKEAQKYGRIESVQIPYNIIDNYISSDSLDFYKKNKISLITYGSLAQGLLSGKYDLDSEFSEKDIRSQKKYYNFHGERFKANLKIVKKIKEVSVKYNKTCAQVAMRWILDNSFVSACLVGIRNPKEIEENIGVMGWNLKREDKNLLTSYKEEIYQEYNTKQL